MSLLLENEFKPLPPDKSVDTKVFLETVSHLPSFFGEYAPPGVGKYAHRAGAARRCNVVPCALLRGRLSRTTRQLGAVIWLTRLTCDLLRSRASHGHGAYRETLCLRIERSAHWPLCALFSPRVARLCSEPSEPEWWSHLIFYCFALKCLSLTDCLGSSVFGIIKSDINGNITVRNDGSVCSYASVCALVNFSCHSAYLLNYCVKHSLTYRQIKWSIPTEEIRNWSRSGQKSW